MIFEYEGGKLDFFKALYEEARQAVGEEELLMQRRFDQYNGSPEIDGSAVPATQVRNITYELIESQITGYIPSPTVKPKADSDRGTRNARSIETLCRRLRDELPFERMNDLDERFSPIYGGSVWLVEWDESIRTHNTVGDVRVTCIPPTDFVPQPNVYEVSDMEYCFVRFETTKEDIVRRYGVSPSVADEAESDLASREDGDTATLYVCYYKDENDKVCQYVWSGDVELLDLDDYYARRRRVCHDCGKKAGLCGCDKPSFDEITAEFEEITEPVTLSDGSVIEPTCVMIENGEIVTDLVREQQVAPDGQMVFHTVGGLAVPAIRERTVPRMEATRLPYYAPTAFPIVIRKNTSKEKALFGQSDCDAIRPQQQGINKLETRIMEKLLRAAVTPVMPEDARIVADNSVFGQVIRLAAGQSAAQYNVVDTTPNITSDLAQSERLYDQAKRILGISDSFQGQHDASALSGKAKELQIRQSAGRLDSKRRMKNAAYADLDRIFFQLYLAYADEPRPSVYVDGVGRRHNVEFNRYDFLLRDEAGKWYYDDRYLFSADATVDLEESRPTLWEENLKAFQMGAYGNPQDPATLLIYWRNMERAHYPHARENVERIEAEVAAQKQMAMAQKQMAMSQQAAPGEVGREGILNNKELQGGNW